MFDELEQAVRGLDAEEVVKVVSKLLLCTVIMINKNFS